MSEAEHGGEALTTIATTCAQLVSSGAEFQLQWEWDERFSAALTTIKSPHDGPLLSGVGQSLQQSWDHRSVGTAPGVVATIAEAWGGLRAGQRLLVLDPDTDPVLFAAWWPWGGGKTFSLRVSCWAQSGSALAGDQLTKLREWFSV